jgi:hypothetical protein
MSFIRTKKFKLKNGKIMEYAYIVENKWRKRRKNKVKQIMSKYLGRVYRFDRVSILDFFEFYKIEDINKYLDSKSKHDILFDLIKLELVNHGFEEKNGLMEKQGCYFDLNERKVHSKRSKKISIAMNEGFLTNYAIKQILKFEAFDEEEDGYLLAKLFVEAGINIPKDIFVGFFKKVYK